MSEEQPKHFRVLEKDGKQIIRFYRRDGSYNDFGICTDPKLEKVHAALIDIPY